MNNLQHSINFKEICFGEEYVCYTTCPKCHELSIVPPSWVSELVENVLGICTNKACQYKIEII